MDWQSDYQLDFFFTAYFGCTRAEVEKDRDLGIRRCVDRAYMDLNRTIKYRISTSKLDEMKRRGAPEKDRKDAQSFMDAKTGFRNAVRGYLVERINVLLKRDDVEEDWFDEDWHEPTCEEVMRIAKVASGDLLREGKPFTVGQAQKWVNMTLKYLIVMGIADCGIAPVLHVPIDSYILEAASRTKGERIYEPLDARGLGIKAPVSEWSKLDEYEVYLDYQKDIRTAVQEVGHSDAISWEGAAWIAQLKAKSAE